MNNIEEIIGDVHEFLNRVAKNLKNSGIDTTKYQIDHVAYRATSTDMYINMTEKLATIGSKIHTKVIRDRNIDIYEIDKPILFDGNQIKYLELMAPAVGDKFSEGLEHVEFVVKGTLQSLVDTYPQFDWNVNSIGRVIGAEVGIYFEDKANVKFKTMSMPEIIQKEIEFNEL